MKGLLMFLLGFWVAAASTFVLLCLLCAPQPTPAECPCGPCVGPFHRECDCGEACPSVLIEPPAEINVPLPDACRLPGGDRQ